MHFSAENHPCKTFLSNQDEFLRRNSSLQDISIKSGCISPPEIIPVKHFLQIRMHFSAGNHLCQTFPPNQDEFPRRNSSRQDFSCKSGCISPSEIIPAKHFLQIRMNPIARNHPCQTLPPNQDVFRPQKAFRQSCAPQAHVSTSTNKPPVSASANKPLSQLLPASSASISALTASTIPESSRMRSLSMRLMGTEMENAYRDPPSSESAAAMQRTPASFSSLSSA